MKDLEVMVQNVIASAFDSLSRVEEGVEILDVFHHFSAREVSIKSNKCYSLQYNIVYGMVWYGMVWCGMVWYGMV